MPFLELHPQHCLSCIFCFRLVALAPEHTTAAISERASICICHLRETDRHLSSCAQLSPNLPYAQGDGLLPIIRREKSAKKSAI
jgi:hypothetical protein